MRTTPPSIPLIVTLPDPQCAETIAHYCAQNGLQLMEDNPQNTPAFYVTDKAENIPSQALGHVLLSHDKTPPNALTLPCHISLIYHTIIRALHAASPQNADTIIPITDILSLHFHAREIHNSASATAHSITETETALLASLLRHRNQPIASHTLLREVWHAHEHADTHTLQTHIYRLRKFFAEHLQDAMHIDSVPQGYRLRVNAAAETAPL